MTPEIAQALRHVNLLCSYAYEQGYHEMGYDPVAALAAALEQSDEMTRACTQWRESYQGALRKLDELTKLKAALRKFTPSKRDPLRCLICEEPRHEHYSGPFAEPGVLYCSKYYVPRAPPAASPDIPRAPDYGCPTCGMEEPHEHEMRPATSADLAPDSPRAIVVGSTWKQCLSPGIHVKVLSVVGGVQYQWCGEKGYDDVSEVEFRMHFTHVSDPVAAQPRAIVVGSARSAACVSCLGDGFYSSDGPCEDCGGTGLAPAKSVAETTGGENG